jgi:hypothetical protein
MVPMGNTFEKRGTMTVRIAKAFAGGPGGQFSRKEPPWPPEAINKHETITTYYIRNG